LNMRLLQIERVRPAHAANVSERVQLVLLVIAGFYERLSFAGEA
jgi:hypothetical protein